MDNLLQIENLAKLYGDKILFHNISFTINKSQKVAIIAKNGTGKSSLLNIITGIDSPDEGIIKTKKQLTFAYLPQSPILDKNKNVIDEILHSPGEISIAVKNYELAIKENNPVKIQISIEAIDRLEAWNYEAKVKQILTILKIDNYYQPVKELSGGQQKRVALAKVLIEDPELFILDEPTNHLDLDMVEWLENFLSQTKASILMVTHDRYFLNNVCNEIIELENGEIYFYEGNYYDYLEKREERIANQKENIQKAKNIFRTELDWMRRMPKARGTKAKYRIDKFQEIKEIASQQIQDDSIKINVKSARLGKKILEVENISKSFGDNKILQEFSYSFNRFEKIGIIGPNGSGKTTFLNIITQLLKPDNGSINIGETIKYGYYKQTGLEFDKNTKVIDLVRKIAEVVTIGDGKILTVEQFLNYFLFGYETHNQFVYKLSGGEQRRLYLVTVLMQNPNFLILDEPTNDLDIHTLNILEDYLINFKGCVIIVSHDRYFMDKVVDHLFVFEGSGKIKNFPGSYTLYREKENTVTKSEKPDKLLKEKAEVKTKPKIITKTKLTYKEKLEFEELEITINRLESEKKILEEELNSGKLNSADLIAKSNQLSNTMLEIDLKTNRWLELSEFI